MKTNHNRLKKVESRESRVESQTPCPRPSTLDSTLDPFSRALAAINVHQEQQRRQFRVMQTDDERLIKVTAWLDAIGGDCLILTDCVPCKRADNESELRYSLANLAAFVLHWLESRDRKSRESRVDRREPDARPSALGPRPSPLDSLWAERQHQRELFTSGRIAFDVSSPVPDVRRKFRVLLEEVGEVAHAIDQIENHDMAAGNLRVELIQVAAVCIAWLESMVPSVPCNS